MLCWVYAKRLMHKLDTFTDLHPAALAPLSALIWRLYAALNAYRTGRPFNATLRCAPGPIAPFPAAPASPPSIARWHGCMRGSLNC